MTKPELGRRMIERCRRARVPFAWVAADSLYGQNRKLRAALERRRIPYVMAVPTDETVVSPGTGPQRADALAKCVPLRFERRSCGAVGRGAGPRGDGRACVGRWTMSGVRWRCLRPGCGSRTPLAFGYCSVAACVGCTVPPDSVSAARRGTARYRRSWGISEPDLMQGCPYPPPHTAKTIARRKNGSARGYREFMWVGVGAGERVGAMERRF
ncbi:transposase [Streptomyces wedmorensis]